MQNVLNNNKNGFTLFEVLISLFILSFGLLTILGLQTAALQRNIDAYFESLATIQAANLAECIHANSIDNCLPDWTQQIAILLPQGSGTCKKNTAGYKISVCWTPHLVLNKKNCLDLNVTD